MSGLYLDAYSGVSGDMLLGALLDLGAPLPDILGQLQTLNLTGWRLEANKITRQGVTGTSARVALDDVHQPARHLPNIRSLLESSGLLPEISASALEVFSLLARAEATVHGTSVEEVHFHEVGAVDAIVDIAGVCAALHFLGVKRVLCSALPLGKGFVRTAHGLLPVPAPATAELLSGCGAPVLLGAGDGEMVTPTGAALVAHFAAFDAGAPVHTEGVGYGFGAREMPWPNALRVFLLRDSAFSANDTNETVLLECNLDDMSGEMVPYVIERLLALGALDAWHTPIGMKKGRPAVLLSALAPAGAEARLARLLIEETTTLGVRFSPRKRYKAGRESRTVHTPYGPVSVKLKLLGGEVIAAAPEYEDCARLARQNSAPLHRVYEAATHAAREITGNRE